MLYPGEIEVVVNEDAVERAVMRIELEKPRRHSCWKCRTGKLLIFTAMCVLAEASIILTYFGGK